MDFGVSSSHLNNKWFVELFDRKYYTYVYVTSKEFSDGNMYYKIGFGKTIQRLREASTFLIPPKQPSNSTGEGFRIHMLIFYEYTPNKGAQYAHQMETILQNEITAKYAVVRHFSSIDSEWFKVDNSKYDSFLDKLERLVLSTAPQPVAFFRLSEPRTRNAQFYREINVKRTREELRTLDSERTQRKRKKQSRETTKGSTDYWTQKIVGKKIDRHRTVQKVEHLPDNTYYVDYTDSRDGRFEKRVPIDVFLDMLTDAQIDEWGIRSNLEWYNIQRYGE